MKHLQFITVILVYLLTFTTSSASERAQYCEILPVGNQYSTLANPLVCSVYFVKSKEQNVHYTGKYKIKNRATASDTSSALKVPFLTKSTLFTILTDRLIYGIAVIYLLQRHCYLHLYQLF